MVKNSYKMSAYNQIVRPDEDYPDSNQGERMHGLVNQAVKDLIVSRFGTQAWSRICAEVSIPEDDFTAMQPYPDSLTYQLIGAVSKELATPAEKVLFEFGKHWVLYTANQGYGPLMGLFGPDLKTFLTNLNNLHTRMGSTLPFFKPPRFVFKELGPQYYRLEYHSQRQGLAPMVLGLIEGLATRFGVTVNIQTEATPSDGSPAVFLIKVA